MLLRKRFRGAVLGLILSPIRISAQASLPMSPPASQFLNRALDLMETNSIHRKELNWPALRADAMSKAKAAETPADTYEAIRFALGRLQDHHSFLQLSPDLQAYSSRRTPEGRIETIEGIRVATLIIPMFETSDDGSMHRYANELQSQMTKLSAQDPSGWIVDLRGNLGGNMWPMLAGAGPLAGDETLGFFVNADIKRTSWFFAADGAGTVSPEGKREIQLWMPGQLVHFSVLPLVAVLIDRGTASSGEAIALSFRGRPNCRFFGRHTHGQTTANDVFPLSEGANLVLTTSLEADRTGKVYQDGLTPDIELPEETHIMPSGTVDPMTQAAAGWIRSNKKR